MTSLGPWPGGIHNTRRALSSAMSPGAPTTQPQRIPAGVRDALGVLVAQDGVLAPAPTPRLLAPQRFSRLCAVGDTVLAVRGGEVYDLGAGVTKVAEAPADVTDVVETAAGTLLLAREGVYRTDGTPLSPPVPPLAGVQVGTGGGLRAGRYGVGVATTTPECDGPFVCTWVDVGDGGKITAAPIQHAADWYLTEPNGTVFYVQASLAAGAAPVLNGVNAGTSTPATEGLYPVPGGQHAAEFNGRLYVADDRVVWLSEAFMPHLCRLATGYLAFPAPVTHLSRSAAGLLINADRLYLLTASELATLSNDPSVSNIVYDDAQRTAASYVSRLGPMRVEFGKGAGAATSEHLRPQSGNTRGVVARLRTGSFDGVVVQCNGTFPTDTQLNLE